MPLLAADQIRQTAERALVRAGVPAPSAVVQVDLWLDAELRGVPSHGLLRLERIVQRIEAGLADPHVTGIHTWQGSSYLAVDGRQGLGPIVANAALARIQERARHSGIAIAAVANAQHIGMLAWYAERVAREGQAAIVLSTSEALVHPWGGRKALVGTNPIAIGIPTGETDPFVMDTATSVVSMGEIHDRANRGQAIPEGWALDADGNPTTDAEAAKRGAIAPFGEAKGYALGLAFELLVASLSGAALGTDVHGTLDTTRLCNKGDVFIVIDGPRVAGLSAYLDIIRSAEPAAGFDAVLVPGERGRANRAARLTDGVVIADPVWARLQQLADGPIQQQQHVLS
ncbi:Ldh family oxidoreductase [Devosia sp.]|uniref:Ldh family oxidoreductase n=1 Tax=Devosia sp. TaxID=1871048 RepID=UPI00261F8630|nr:Ldh family oxidoreductase [Devosia sp.]